MRFWTRRDGTAFALTFLAAFGVYLYALPPSITLEDAGELAVAADYLGVPHPPGYPIWTFSAWLFQWVFHALEFRGYPNPAWPIAMMSAVFGSLSCGLIAMLTTHFSRRVSEGLSSSRSTLRSHPVPLGAGIGWGLVQCLLLQRFSGVGTVVFQLSCAAYLSILLLQVLTPRDRRYRLQERLPSPGQLGLGFAGATMAGLCWLTVWGWLPVPSVSLVLPLALLGAVGVWMLMAGVDALLGRAARKGGLEEAIQTGGADILLGVGAGLLLAFTPLMWSQSVIIEVYSLNAFFLSCLLVLMFRYLHDPRDRWLYLAGFLFALGLTNHQALAFLLFFLVAAVAAAGRRHLLKDGLFLIGVGALAFFLFKARQYLALGDESAGRYFLSLGIVCVLFLLVLVATRGGLFRTWRQLIALLALGALGLGFHLFMPVASEQNPPMNWGYARTPEGFRHAVTRGQYAKFAVADNFRQIGRTMGTDMDPAWLEEGNERLLARGYARRTLFPRQLGAYFFDPGWKYSIANQFSWEFPSELPDPEPDAPPPEETWVPLALIGLVPLLSLFRLDSKSRGWFLSTLVAMCFVTVVFLIVQWPDLNHNDLWVKRVQYVQAHVVFSLWMGFGALLILLMLYGLLPFRRTVAIGALVVAALYIVFPLHKDAKDARHLEHLGSSNFHGNTFGWQYGFHQLKGANGILLDELAHHKNPDCLIDEWARAYLKRHGVADEIVAQATELAPDGRHPLRQFRTQVVRTLGLEDPEARLLEQAAQIAAFRALSPEEQEKRLVYLHRPLPDWDYPAEMAPGAIHLGGTDPGRFVPTYMIFSADVRPDVYLVTQNALADPTYLDSMRDLYGDEIYIPDTRDGNRAFNRYMNRVRLFNPDEFGRMWAGGSTLSVSGAHKVNRINAVLSRWMFEHNRGRHAFYLEEAYQHPWMTRHQIPHGLIFKLEPEPRDLLDEEIRNDFAFWDWYVGHLEATDRFRRDLTARRSFAKLRLSQAWNYLERGRTAEAERAMNQARRLHPANPETALRAVELYMRVLNFDRAEAELNAFARHDPTHRQIPSFRETLSHLRNLNRTRMELESELDRRLAESPTLRGLGNLTLQLVQTYGYLEMDAAMEQSTDLLLRIPNLHPDFYKELARFMREEEQKELYLLALKTWAEKAPGNYRPHVELAAAALAGLDILEAYRHMTGAVQRAPVEARRALAEDPRFIDLRSDRHFRKLITPPPGRTSRTPRKTPGM